MAKIIQITENQYNNLKQKMLLESNNDDFKDFIVLAEVEFELSSKNFDGRYVYGVETADKYSNNGRADERIRVLFDMEYELSRSGLDGITIENVRGDNTLDVKIELEPLTDDDEDFSFDHKLILDWAKAEVIYDEGDGKIPTSIERIVLFLDDSFFVNQILVYPSFN